MTHKIMPSCFATRIRTYFFVSNVEVATQNNRFLSIKGFEVSSEVFVPSLPIAKPKCTLKQK